MNLINRKDQEKLYASSPIFLNRLEIFPAIKTQGIGKDHPLPNTKQAAIHLLGQSTNIPLEPTLNHTFFYNLRYCRIKTQSETS
jgi:hypothetical protein